MIWVLVLLAGCAAIPLTIEWTRTPITKSLRAKAPGNFALLSQGTTHFEWIGPERAPVAVCVHGLTTPAFVWRSVAKGLVAMGFRVLIYDLYGRGLSDRAGGRQTAAFFITQLEDLLDQEHVNEPVTLLGYSMGGAIASAFAAHAPERVKQLILLAPAGMGHLSGLPITLARDVPVIGDWLFLLLYPLQLRRGITAEADLLSTVADIGTLQQIETTRRGFFPAVLSSLRGLLRHPLSDAHATIAASGLPVLAIWGAQDAVIPLQAHDTLAEWNPQARQHVIDDAGHALPYTHTEAVLEAIRGSRS